MVHSRSYEKVIAPAFPTAANCSQWLMQLAMNLIAAGGYTDQLEGTWIKEVLHKSFDELADGGSERMRKADLALAKALQSLINNTKEPLKNDVSRKQTVMFSSEGGKLIGGRQLTHMILNYFKTHRDLQRRHTWEDINTIKWKGDQHLYDTYCHWEMIVSAIPWPIHESEKIAAFCNIFRPSKKLEADMNVFDRLDDDDPKRTLTFLTDALEKIFARDRTLQNRRDQIAAHAKFGGASGNLNTGGGFAAPAKGKDKGKGKGKGQDKGKGKNGGKHGGNDGSGGATVPKFLEGLKFCKAFALGHCQLTAEECKKQRGFSHISRPQLITMLGVDPFKSFQQNGGGQGGDGDGGKAKGKGGKGKNKGRGKGKATPATESGDEAPCVAAELHKWKTKQLVCSAFQKGNCRKGEQCQFAHLDSDAASEVRRAHSAWKKSDAAKRSASAERASQ